MTEMLSIPASAAEPLFCVNRANVFACLDIRDEMLAMKEEVEEPLAAGTTDQQRARSVSELRPIQRRLEQAEKRCPSSVTITV